MTGCEKIPLEIVVDDDQIAWLKYSEAGKVFSFYQSKIEKLEARNAAIKTYALGRWVDQKMWDCLEEDEEFLEDCEKRG